MKITAHEVHLWCARDEEITAPGLLASYHAILNEEERARQGRFHFEKHRHQYLVARALVRSVLSLYVDNIPPEAWQFRKNSHDKPYIKNFPLPFALNFNLSHTEKMLVLAVTLDKEIGVDIEYLQRRNAGLDIAKRFFSATEFRSLSELPAEVQKRRFFDLWTLKEAYIKACGMGLAIPLDDFSYSFPSPGEIQLSFDPQRDDHPRYWSLWQVKPDDAHIIGLAVQGSGHYRLSMREIIPLKGFREVDCHVIARSRLD